MIVLDVLPFDFQCAVFKSHKAAEKWFAKHHDVQIDAVENATAYCCAFECDDMYWFYMVIPKDLPVAKIAHECVHLADFTMERAGCPTDASNTELRAYIVDKAIGDIMRWRE